MKIATWNVNSIAIRLEAVLNWLDTTKTDVLCLQEIKCVDEKFPRDEFMTKLKETVVCFQQDCRKVFDLTVEINIISETKSLKMT